MNAAELRAVVRLCHEAGHLKHSRRTGWWRAGVKDPETVAEHSWRTALIAYFLAIAEGADPGRTVTIGVFHDLAEARTGDIEYVGKHYVAPAAGEAIIRDQADGLPAAVMDGLLAIVAQAEHHDLSPEAMCAQDADKLECLLQAREYEQQGYQNARMWAESMVSAVRTQTGRALAAAAMEADPSAWWREIIAPAPRPNAQ